MSKAPDPLVESVRTHPLFAGLGDKAVAHIAALVEPLKLRQGATVMLERYHGEQLLIITSGEVEVTRDGDHVATVGAGSFIGEMGMLRGADRSATVRATSDVKLLTLDRAAFDELVGKYPQVRARLEDEMHARDAEG